jgi:hypothetical protein
MTGNQTRLIGMFAMWLMLSAPCLAQSRKRVTISSPSTVGRFTTGTTTFNSYSSGIGNLSSGGGVSNSILRSKVSSPARSVSQQRGMRSTAGRGTSALSQSRQVMRSPSAPSMKTPAGSRNAARMPGTSMYTQQNPDLAGATPVVPQARSLPGATSTEGFFQRNHQLSSLSSGTTYFQAVGSAENKPMTSEDNVTSLVPDEPGPYREMMKVGERELRQRNYRRAAAKFELARDLSMNSPETMLHLFHTHFATAGGVYTLASHYLQETLKVFPELPLVNIQPKFFYSEQELYLQDLTALQRYLQRTPQDADAQLVHGYLQFRQGEVEDARRALAEVVQAKQNKALSETARILWDGIVATGQAEGGLQPSPDLEKVLDRSSNGATADSPEGEMK